MSKFLWVVMWEMLRSWWESGLWRMIKLYPPQSLSIHPYTIHVSLRWMNDKTILQHGKGMLCLLLVQEGNNVFYVSIMTSMTHHKTVPQAYANSWSHISSHREKPDFGGGYFSIVVSWLEAQLPWYWQHHDGNAQNSKPAIVHKSTHAHVATLPYHGGQTGHHHEALLQ
jgi:hypothetical protein